MFGGIRVFLVFFMFIYQLYRCFSRVNRIWVRLLVLQFLSCFQMGFCCLTTGWKESSINPSGKETQLTNVLPVKALIVSDKLYHWGEQVVEVKTVTRGIARTKGRQEHIGCSTRTKFVKRKKCALKCSEDLKVERSRWGPNQLHT